MPALDVSTQLLDSAGKTAVEAAVQDRPRRHRVDLYGAWDAAIPNSVDLDWATLSLRHVFSLLSPRGSLVLTEMSGPEKCESEELHSGNPGLRDWACLAARRAVVIATGSAPNVPVRYRGLHPGAPAMQPA